MNGPAAKVILGRDVYIAPSAFVGGDVVLGDECTVMHHATIRGDLARIVIGHRVNIQDGAVLHTDAGVDLLIGDSVAIGHRAVVHGHQVGTRTLIGIGAIVLDHCEIEPECIIAAGALLPPGTVVPRGTVMMGSPARPIRSTTSEDLAVIDHAVASYLEVGRRFRRGEFPAARSGAGPADW